MEFDASLNPFLRCARDINTSLLNWPLKSAHGALTIFSSNSFFSLRIRLFILLLIFSRLLKHIYIYIKKLNS